MKQFLKKYSHAWILSYVFVYLSWFSYLEKTVTKEYSIIHSAVDDFIPFCEYFIVPYLLWFLYVSVAVLYFFFTSKQDYYRLCAFLFTGMTLSLLICTVFPNGTNFRPHPNPDANVFAWIVSRLYQVDTCTNVFPSIHVYNSIAVHMAVSHSEQLRGRRLVQTASLFLMISICLSTVFLKQHSVIDMAGAFFMAALIYPLVYRVRTHPSYKHASEIYE